MSDVGKSITQAVAFISRVGDECEALANLIRQEVSEMLLRSQLVNVYTPDEWSPSNRTNKKGWVRRDSAWSLPLNTRAERTVTAHLAFQMSLLCDDLEGGFSPEPLLHINFWGEATDMKRESYMGFEMHGITQSTLLRLRQDDARLFRWEAEDGRADWWTYTLRLADLNSLDDVRTLICAPVERLLADVDQGEAALDQIENVVRYRAVAELPDCYRVVL